MNTRFPTVIAALLAGAVLFFSLSGCQAPVAQAEGEAAKEVAAEVPRQIPVGASCTIQFRRDALGANMSLPISPTTDSINGAIVSVSGTLAAINDEWVVISDADNQQTWIPRSMILLVRVAQ